MNISITASRGRKLACHFREQTLQTDTLSEHFRTTVSWRVCGPFTAGFERDHGRNEAFDVMRRGYYCNLDISHLVRLLFSLSVNVAAILQGAT